MSTRSSSAAPIQSRPSSTRFNGFGDAVTIEAKDAPWPSMYGEATAPVVAMKRKRAPRKPKRA